ncbi:MAG: hypothetical protein MJZ24_07140, partial [Paludibacteraceae bacterium]|nr:hypothetical protein [Paludibacteraceae bacterium]
MFAITTVANAAPIIRRAEAVRVNEEVATSAVVRRAEAVRVNEEVATSAVFKGVESKSGMEVAARFGWPRVSDTEDPTVFGAKVPATGDTERATEIAYQPSWFKYHVVF